MPWRLNDDVTHTKRTRDSLSCLAQMGPSHECRLMKRLGTNLSDDGLQGSVASRTTMAAPQSAAATLTAPHVTSLAATTRTSTRHGDHRSTEHGSARGDGPATCGATATIAATTCLLLALPRRSPLSTRLIRQLATLALDSSSLCHIYQSNYVNTCGKLMLRRSPHKNSETTFISV